MSGSERSPARVMLLGDSVTFAGGWAGVLQRGFLLHHGERAPEVINLGVSSETVSGLSEPDHPFPRPCVLGRVDCALERLRPDVTVVSYGINDGVYAPYEPDRFAAFTDGYRELVARLHRAGSTVIAISPHPFEIDAWADHDRRAAGLPQTDYSYLTPYVDYDAEVLTPYGTWLTEDLSDDIETVVDVRPVFEADRAATGDRLTGDGIHPGARGHWLIGCAVLEQAFGLPVPPGPAWLSDPPDPVQRTIGDAVAELGTAWREEIGHDSPFRAEARSVADATRRAEQARARWVRLAAADDPAPSSGGVPA